MKTRLVLIEGIPGTGKTTLAEALCERFRAGGLDAAWYLEEAHHHPVTPREGRPPDRTGRIPWWLERWRTFAESGADRERVRIVEGTAFQSTARFLYAGGLEDDAILPYLAGFERAVASLRPCFVYLDAREPRRFLARHTLPRKGADWTARVAAYAVSTPVARRRGWSGEAGLVEFWADYRDRCDAWVETLRMPTLRAERPPASWADSTDAVERWLRER